VTFDRTRIKSLDWSSYQIMRFTDTPDSVEVEVIDRPGQPFLGTGEVSQGPAAAAIANAVANATGQRLRELPFTRAKVKRRSVYRRDLLFYMPPGASGAG
jgi:nicotinate dehydrogenase subunit B